MTNFKAPPVSGYRFVLKAVNTFLDKSYKALLDHLENGLPIWHMGDRIVHPTVQNACWALREHFMYHTNTQRTGQYSPVLCKEFLLYLMHKVPNLGNVLAAPKRQVMEHVPLDRYSWAHGSEEERTIMAMQQAMADKPNKYCFEIRRVPDKIDKRIRNKDNPWHHWVFQDVQQFLYAVHYFTILHPMLKQVSEQHNMPFTSHCSARSCYSYRWWSWTGDGNW
jgi:hypothetical protein